MSQTQPTRGQGDVVDSEDFPAGYGDLALISSDSVTFHFPRGVLEHVSPVFRDMFYVGGATHASTQVPLQLTEDADTLQFLLSFVDPLKDRPKINSKTLFSFLEAARKYQIPNAMKWFREQVVTEGGPANHLATENPMWILHIGEEFNCDETRKYAMRLVIKAKMTYINSYPAILPPKVYLDLFNRRTKRAQVLSGILVTLVSKLIQEMEMEMDRKLKLAVTASVNFRPYPDHRPRKHGTQESGTQSPCGPCRTRAHTTISEITGDVMVHPNWDTCLSVLKSRLNLDCTACARNLYKNLLNLRTGLGESVFDLSRRSALKMEAI
jgi:hypothetical protein